MLVALWLSLPVLYPLSGGPIFYACIRDFWPGGFRTYDAAYRPLDAALDYCPDAFGDACVAYLLWWDGLAARHKRAEAGLPP